MRPSTLVLAATAAVSTLGMIGLLTTAAGEDVKARPDITFEAADMTVTDTPPIAQAGANVDLSVPSDGAKIVGATTPIADDTALTKQRANDRAAPSDQQKPVASSINAAALNAALSDSARQLPLNGAVANTATDPLPAPAAENAGNPIEFKPTDNWTAQLSYRYMSVGGKDMMADACCAADGKGWKLDQQNAAAHLGFTYHFD